MIRIHVNDGSAQERARYAEIWSFDEYKEANSPGLENVDRFMKVLEPKPGSSIIDIGCGQGQAGLALAERGLDVWWLDITDAGLDLRIDRSRFLDAALWDNWAGKKRWDYAFCCDVLEHIPTEYVMLAVDRIVKSARVAWIQLSHLPDLFGPKLLGEPLHLTVQDHSWWMIRFATVSTIMDARDLCGGGLYIVREKEEKDVV